MSTLLTPSKIGGLDLKNRVIMSPMCMYEAEEGLLKPFHFAHYGARAIGNVGLIILEATGVSPIGRITPNDLGLWNDAQQQQFLILVTQLHELGSKVGIQLQHAGRKAMHLGTPLAPSAINFDTSDTNYLAPKEMTLDDIQTVINQFVDSAKRAQAAGFDVIEIHGAHGYLINQFLEPQSNKRTDAYGGTLENRARILREIVSAIKQEVSIPIWVRLSVSAYAENQTTLEEYQTIAKWLQDDGVSALDISTGGLLPIRPNFPISSGYQVSFAKAIKSTVSIDVTAVGLLNDANLAEYLVTNGEIDAIMIGRGFLQSPNWVAQAAAILHDKNYKPFNNSYARAPF